jgi:hypothetical protein
VRLRIDPRFYLADFNPGVAWTQLRAVAAQALLRVRVWVRVRVGLRVGVRVS